MRNPDTIRELLTWLLIAATALAAWTYVIAPLVPAR